MSQNSHDHSHFNPTPPPHSASPNSLSHSIWTPTSSSSTSPVPTVMDQQLAQIVGAIQALDSKVKFRFDNLERRIANIENDIVRLAGPAALPGPPAHSASASSQGVVPLSQASVNAFSSAGHGHAQAAPQPAVVPSTSSASLGNQDSVKYLPFAIVSGSQCTKGT